LGGMSFSENGLNREKKIELESDKKEKIKG